jgi:ATP-dependent RNA helicase DDX27
MAKKLTQEFVRIKGPREPERPAFLLALCTRTFKKKTIVFFQHKHTCHQMRIYFGLAGLKAGEIHGNLPQDKVRSKSGFDRPKFFLTSILAFGSVRKLP